ncbi:hypothetical protein [Myxococcus sp. RHSTA-1-4]|uniref:hypothetical protein n=1 Tax=Myxococcus sp. RHSTA-1-4 TaxID=2874601 RepID=UPI001CBC1497|nr:hypothetical protein [Myxococcus sp. RHSTA-1-4]MBZ4422564.1 hypothetical protein [Myxococcus sp. RHSTA-1-4]
MPLPLIPAALFLAGLAGYGGKKAYDGIQSMKEARETGEAAEALHKAWVARLEEGRSELQARLDALEGQRRTVTVTTFRRLFDFLERLEQKARLAALDSLGALGVSREEVRQFAAQYLEAGGTLSGAVTAALTGAGASAVTTGLVTSFATAGTGAAISGLSGAAAKSAVLAWLGGGSLATGGFGVAGGTVILGGIAIAPAVAVAGFVIAREGEKAKTRAEAYAAEVEQKVAHIEAALAVLTQAGARVDELRWVTQELDVRANRALDALWTLDGVFDADNEQHLRKFATAMQLVKAESELLRVQLFTADGGIDAQVETLLARQRRLLEEGLA